MWFDYRDSHYIFYLFLFVEKGLNLDGESISRVVFDALCGCLTNKIGQILLHIMQFLYNLKPSEVTNIKTHLRWYKATTSYTTHH